MREWLMTCQQLASKGLEELFIAHQYISKDQAWQQHMKEYKCTPPTHTLSIHILSDSDLFLQKTWNKGHWPLDDLWPHICWGHVWLYPRIIVSKSHENTSKYVDSGTLFAKTWTKGHWPLDDLWPHICWGHMCDSTQGSLCPSPMEYINVCGYSDQFCKLPTKDHWPPDDLWPHICWGLMCDSTQGSLCPSPMKIHQSMWIQWPFLQKKKLNQMSLTPRWPLTPHLLRSHVWLYPRIIVSKSHENTSKYVDTVNLFAKTWIKVIDPYMTFDPTYVEVTCVTLPKDHCVQVPWKYIKVCGYSEPFC